MYLKIRLPWANTDSSGSQPNCDCCKIQIENFVAVCSTHSTSFAGTRPRVKMFYSDFKFNRSLLMARSESKRNRTESGSLCLCLMKCLIGIEAETASVSLLS